MSNLLVKSPPTSRDHTARIGPISLFALVVIICMATLAVLAVSTAHSSLVLSQRQAAATQELYLDETAAQTFVAELDEVLAGNAGAGGASALEPQLVALRDKAQAATDGRVEVVARIDGNNVHAEFSCAGGRTLKVSLSIQPDGSWRIDRWRMTAVVNEEQPIGTLYTGA